MFSSLFYSIEFWGNAVNSFELFSMQKKCVYRASIGAGPRDSCVPTFNALKIPTLVDMYIWAMYILTPLSSDNRLPAGLKAVNLVRFKRSLKIHLSERCHYDLKSFFFGVFLIALFSFFICFLSNLKH